MKTSGNFVSGSFKFSTGVKCGHDDLCSGALLDWVLTDWNTTTVIDHGYAAILMDDDGDLLAKAAYSLVYRVIDDFIDKMVQTLGTRSPDIHCWPFSNRIKAFENLDRARVIAHSKPILGRLFA